MSIKKARKLKGMSQKALAAALSVSQPTVSDWESGRKMPTRGNLLLLADILDSSVDFLLTGSEKTPSPSEDDIKFALFGETEVDDELFDEVKRFARYAKMKKDEGTE